MIYGTEAIIPSKIGRSSMRILDFTPDRNDANLAEDLDLLEERWEVALIRLADYQQKCKAKKVCRKGSSIAKGGEKYERFKCRKACPKLRRPISNHYIGGG